MMNRFTRFALIALGALAIHSGSALAASDTSTDAAKKPMSDADKLAKAQDCSRQADAKKLHGMARKKFREECKKS